MPAAGTEPEAVLESLKSWGRIWGVKLPFFVITPNLLFPPNRLNIHFRKPALPILNKTWSFITPNMGLNPECCLPAPVTKRNRQVMTARTSAHVWGRRASNALAEIPRALALCQASAEHLLSVASVILPTAPT